MVTLNLHLKCFTFGSKIILMLEMAVVTSGSFVTLEIGWQTSQL